MSYKSFGNLANLPKLIGARCPLVRHQRDGKDEGMVVVISLVLEINLIKNLILNSSTRLLIYWTQVVCFDRSRQNKHRHRRHIASCWSPCLSLMAAAGTIRKSIVLRFFWYPILFIQWVWAELQPFPRRQIGGKLGVSVGLSGIDHYKLSSPSTLTTIPLSSV